ncbi:hypothetical protein PsorP6_002131 [Peronosclerospora sorghi]|uniref:Uncharacterized protein n=1 Tax=Peronosclerospora sorghi TaxID=230839 RepID=A0ACC0WUW1_9STRA|nr:hypothetical protein PsorP6_002131 [Peronosclerospora sorghi]
MILFRLCNAFLLWSVLFSLNRCRRDCDRYVGRTCGKTVKRRRDIVATSSVWYSQLQTGKCIIQERRSGTSIFTIALIAGRNTCISIICTLKGRVSYNGVLHVVNQHVVGKARKMALLTSRH